MHTFPLSICSSRSTRAMLTPISPDPHTTMATSPPRRGPVWTLRSAPASLFVDACHSWTLYGDLPLSALSYLSRQHFWTVTHESARLITECGFFHLHRSSALVKSSAVPFIQSFLAAAAFVDLHMPELIPRPFPQHFHISAASSDLLSLLLVAPCLQSCRTIF